jgi:hypothetical protein
MTQVVSPVAPQFISLTEAEVLAALDDPNRANPIARVSFLSPGPHLSQVMP